MGERSASRSRGCRLVRRQDARRGEGHRSSTQQGRPRQCDLRPPRAIPATASLAQECQRHCASAAAPVLGREQDGVIFDGPAVQIRQGDCVADSLVSLTRCAPHGSVVGPKRSIRGRLILTEARRWRLGNAPPPNRQNLCAGIPGPTGDPLLMPAEQDWRARETDCSSGRAPKAPAKWRPCAHLASAG
jgi:hypothetical protein